MGRVEGKTAVVTGGAKGIGKAAAIMLAAEGARVAVTDIDDGQGENVVREITDDGGEAGYFHLDVSQEEQVREVFAEVEQRSGKIEVLVNNAGISGVNRQTHEIDREEWKKVISINLNGVFYCTKHALPQMLDNGGGSIINLSSIYGIISNEDLPPYHASKGAVRLMSKTDALFYAKKNIRVNSVHPGYILTPLVEEIAGNSPQGKEDFLEYLAGLHPVGRLGKPEEIAAGILFLASDESSFVTGSELVIDGGYTAR